MHFPHADARTRASAGHRRHRSRVPPSRAHRDSHHRPTGSGRTRQYRSWAFGTRPLRRGIFERFFQTSVAKPYGGVGLGLYISREIVTRMGGDIQLSSSDGHGSVFWVTWPLQRVPAASVT